jgi:hypothetical protein
MGKISPPFQRRSTPDHKLTIDIRNYIQGGGGLAFITTPSPELDFLIIAKFVAGDTPPLKRRGNLRTFQTISSLTK